MRNAMRTVSAAALAIGAALIPVDGTAIAGAADPASAAPSPYAPLAFLVGHCWKGTLPDGKRTDEHCFSWVYDGKFVRDRHTLREPGQPNAFGESIYFWNPAGKQIEYLYFESGGGYSHGTVSADGDALSFPPTAYTGDGKTQAYRSRWQRSGNDAYEVVTEFQSRDTWVPGFKVRMEKVVSVRSRTR